MSAETSAAPSATGVPIGDLLADLRQPALVLAGCELAGDLPAGTVLTRLGEPPPADGRWTSVALVVPDLAALRRAASVLPPLGRARRVLCVVARADSPPVPLRRPEWPDLVDLEARSLPGGGAVTRLAFARGAPVEAVLAELARRAGRAVTGNAGVFLAVSGTTTAPPADPSVRLVDDAAAAGDPALEVPPDAVLGVPATALDPHPVTGRAPVLVQEADDLAVGPLDEALLNPRGFRAGWDEGAVDLPPEEPTPGLVARLRAHQAVRVAWPDGDLPVPTARTVAGLAMAGVPLVAAGPAPARARALLGAELADLLAEPVDLDRPLRREEHSVRLRRAALVRHSTAGWRGRVAARAGVRHAAYPSVSVLLATRRPEQLDFALRQVARQRSPLPGASLELVLAGHGWQPDPARVRAALGDLPHQVLSLPAELPFGEVLARATDAAGGDVVLKMDDDDWYGADLVTDLLVARRHSGAHLVGMPAEFVYLEPIRTTVRRRGASEVPAAVVAGGTMLIDRPLLRGLGGFRPVRRFVDAQLLASVRAAGGTTYRTQGLGYVLRRGSGGHTWDTGLGYFLTRRSLVDQWRGFRPSRLLEHDPADVPQQGGAR